MDRNNYIRKMGKSKSKDTNMTKVSFRLPNFLVKDIKRNLSYTDMSFSYLIRVFVVYSYVKKARGKLVYFLDSEDKKKLQNFLYYLSKISTNLNQDTHAVNLMKGYAFLDYRHDELMGKLDSIDQSLKDINDNLDFYQDEISAIFKRFR